jgi:16S rRNA (cytidine1402-2'-O)-methyltransferase
MSSLNLISLPIGNIEDITLRALKSLKEFKIIYAEDTRVFKDLLKQLEIDYSDKEIDSFHDHSNSKTEKIIKRILNGDNVALVSDAGSPIISDPAYPLIKRCVEEKISIQSFPGVTSAIVGLELSGLPSNPFHFWGFLGRSNGDKKSFFKELLEIEGTHIFFESPHRIYETIKLFFESHSEKEIIIARELTKKFQEVVRIRAVNISELENLLIDKGEFVLLFHQSFRVKNVISDALKIEIEEFIDNGGNTKKLAKIFSKVLGEDTKDIYSRLSRQKE